MFRPGSSLHPTRNPVCPRSLARGKLEVKGSMDVWAPAGEARVTRTGARQHGLGRPGMFPAAGAGWAGRRNRGARGRAGAGKAGEPAEAARPGEKGQSFLARSAVLELGAACGTQRQGCPLSRDSARAEAAFPGGWGPRPSRPSPTRALPGPSPAPSPKLARRGLRV